MTSNSKYKQEYNKTHYTYKSLKTVQKIDDNISV